MTRPASGSRGLSGLELLIGAAIVVGHNLLGILPNEVPILVALGLVSLRLRSGGWAALGLGRPPSWRRTLVIALAVAALRILLAEFVVDPLTALYWPPAAAPSGADQIAGNPRTALLFLLLVWSFAAFGEEIAYRGYLMTRAADLGRGSRAASWLAVVAIAVLFGVGHAYKGPAGMIDSGMAGLLLGAAYMLSGRNLWASVLAHGFIDTVAIALLYFGLDA